MSSKLFRSSAIVLGMGTAFVAFMLLLLSGTADGQIKVIQKMDVKKADGPPGAGKGANPDDPNSIGEFGAVTLPTDKNAKGKIEAARDYINQKEPDWPKAIHLLQNLLDLDKEDVVVPVTRQLPDGREVVNWVSVRVEANRLIGTLPKEGMEFYRLRNNQKAAELLKQAKEASDERLLARVATAYLHTDAGAEATELLGTRKLDRGHSLDAALYFERLINRQGADKVSPLTLFKAKLAFSRARDKANADLVSRQLETRAPDGLKLGEKSLSLHELNELISKYGDALRSLETIYDWPLGIGGKPDRNAQGVGGHPFLEKAWHQLLFMEDSYSNDENKRKGQAALWVETALKMLDDRKLAAIPAFHPVAATADVPGRGPTQLIVYRSHWGIHAVDIKTGKLAWEADAKWSLEQMFKEARSVQAISQWKQQYEAIVRQSIVLENSIIGSLSTDGQRVYMIDDLAVPPYVAHFMNQWGGGGQPQFPWGQEINEAMSHSVLQAFDLGSGKMLWRFGGRGDKFEANDPKGELHDSYFLGSPLAMGGKLYVLTDKNQELRLVCLDPANKGGIVWIQTLATTKEKMLMDVGRRSHAAPMAYGEGILVCPTNAGAVIGVDFLTHSLLWAYAYRDRAAVVAANDPNQMGGGMRMKGGMVAFPNGEMGQQPATNLSDWKASAPVIADGKVVFTAPDGTTVDCLNLRDGSRVWRASKLDGDLYLAGVYAGKALIVGRDRCRALDLKDGGQAWVLETGMPSGRGVASENVYYLPLKASAPSPHEPAVCAIDMNRGAVMSHTKSRKDQQGRQEVPGNLLFYEGKMLSQTATHVIAYPQLKIKLQEIDERIAKDPRDPAGLTERGALRLDEGKLQGAVDDLRTAMANNPSVEVAKRTREKLYEAMTDLFRDQFNDAEKYLPEYEAMSNIPVNAQTPAEEKQKAEEEHQKRQSTFLYLIAKGRESQGRLVEAFDYYQRFGAFGAKRELVGVPDEPTLKAPPDKWAQGRIENMVAKATPEARIPLEQQIAKNWEDVKKTGDTEKLRQFVTMFGTLFRAGREARLELAERLVEENSKNSMLDAERHLLLLRGQKDDAPLAARAVETLARLWTRQGLLEDAAYLYRDVLAKDFAKTVVRDGKTGADLFAELATDKRFLPYIDEPTSGPVIQGKIEVQVERNTTPPPQQTLFGFEPQGELLPFFQRHRVALNVNFHQFKLIDRKTGEERMTENMTHTRFGEFLYTGMQNHVPRHTYHMVGHIVVLPLAHMVFGIDPINKKVLWEKSLFGTGPRALAQTQHQSFTVDPRDGQLVLLYPDGYQQKLGQTGPIGASYVCLQTRDGLLALDPVSGRTLWTRSDVSTRSQMFGDDQHVYLVEVSADGTTGGSRAFRASDGVSVKVPDFSAFYQKRIRTIGRNILLSDATDKALTLRLYDVHEGKDVWKQEFKANSVVLKSEDPNFAGAIEPDGKATVVDLTTQKEVLKAAVDPKHIAKAQSVALLQDAQHFYFAVNLPSDPANNQFGGTQPGLMPGSGMRSIPINGFFYALDRKTGKLKWHSGNEVKDQMVVLEHFREMPIIMFTARSVRGAGNGVRNWNTQVTSFRSLDKRTGKLLHDDDQITNNIMFHALNMDLRHGRIDLLGHNLKISHILPGSDAAAGKEQPATPKPAVTQPSTGVRRTGRVIQQAVPLEPVPKD